MLRQRIELWRSEPASPYSFACQRYTCATEHSSISCASSAPTNPRVKGLTPQEHCREEDPSYHWMHSDPRPRRRMLRPYRPERAVVPSQPEREDEARGGNAKEDGEGEELTLEADARREVELAL